MAGAGIKIEGPAGTVEIVAGATGIATVTATIATEIVIVTATTITITTTIKRRRRVAGVERSEPPAR
jgi:hypothetical protein